VNRELDPVFLQARGAIEPLLESKGFSIYGESHHPGSFGSAEAEYQRRGLRIRLTWDGKDRWIWLQLAAKDGNRLVKPSEWKDLETALGAPAIAVGVLRPGPLADRRIEELVAHAREFLDGDTAF
jgi:hypothetical protein